MTDSGQVGGDGRRGRNTESRKRSDRRAVFPVELTLPGGVRRGADVGVVRSQGDPGGARWLRSGAGRRQVSPKKQAFLI